MQPQRNDGFQPKWTHFHPQATVWVQNPFSHDVVFKVADEMGDQYTYRMPAGEVSELPGGAVATLGVKEIVDELIQNKPEEILRIWDKEVRAAHENAIIVKIKEAPLKTATTARGEINLASSDQSLRDDDIEETDIPPEEPFPSVSKEPVDEDVKAAAKAALASLPKSKVIED